MQYAVNQAQNTIRTACERLIVRDDHETRAERLIEVEHQLENRFGRVAVEVSRRLGSQDTHGPGHESTREGGPLSFATRKLTGRMRQAMR